MNQFTAEILRDQYKKLVKLGASLCGFDSLEEFIEEWEAIGSPWLDPDAQVFLSRKKQYDKQGKELAFQSGNVKWVNVRYKADLASVLAPGIEGSVSNEQKGK